MASKENIQKFHATKDRSDDGSTRYGSSTIPTYAPAMLHLLEFVYSKYADKSVHRTIKQADTHIRSIEWNATGESETRQSRCCFEEKEEYQMTLEEISKFIDSEVHTRVIQPVVTVGWEDDVSKWDRLAVFELQCHLEILTTLKVDMCHLWHKAKRDVKCKSYTRCRR